MEGASTQRHAVRGFGGSSRLSRDSATTVHRTQLPTPAHAHHATPHDTRTRVKAEVPLVIGYGASGRANAWHGCCPCAHTAHGERVETAPCGMAARRKVADMQMQAQISKRVATHARLRIQPEGSARKGNSAHTSLVVCLHRIDHVCQSHRLPLRSMWRARSAQGKAPAVRERGSINRMRGDGAGDACAPREFALIGSC